MAYLVRLIDSCDDVGINVDAIECYPTVDDAIRGFHDVIVKNFKSSCFFEHSSFEDVLQSRRINHKVRIRKANFGQYISVTFNENHETPSQNCVEVIHSVSGEVEVGFYGFIILHNELFPNSALFPRGVRMMSE